MEQRYRWSFHTGFLTPHKGVNPSSTAADTFFSCTAENKVIGFSSTVKPVYADSDMPLHLCHSDKRPCLAQIYYILCQCWCGLQINQSTVQKYKAILQYCPIKKQLKQSVRKLLYMHAVWGISHLWHRIDLPRKHKISHCEPCKRKNTSDITSCCQTTV